ncbi:hypothetical protein [Cyanothece sp. BG0011]|uniref:hypothetical protein n=1 Tax=Cyanothece sp. BG0011 TaxID=2082950 RepID=UPI000D1F6104|nr:hypothetical protein [Cyanothece sp. BG0011]
MNSLKRNACLALLTTSLVVGGATVVQAQNVDFQEEMDKITTLAITLAGVVAVMTDVVILPMGISSAVRTFRHVVLQNV